MNVIYQSRCLTRLDDSRHLQVYRKVESTKSKLPFAIKAGMNLTKFTMGMPGRPNRP